MLHQLWRRPHSRTRKKVSAFTFIICSCAAARSKIPFARGIQSSVFFFLFFQTCFICSSVLWTRLQASTQHTSVFQLASPLSMWPRAGYSSNNNKNCRILDSASLLSVFRRSVYHLPCHFQWDKIVIKYVKLSTTTIRLTPLLLLWSLDACKKCFRQSHTTPQTNVCVSVGVSGMHCVVALLWKR